MLLAISICCKNQDAFSILQDQLEDDELNNIKNATFEQLSSSASKIVRNLMSRGLQQSISCQSHIGLRTILEYTGEKIISCQITEKDMLYLLKSKNYLSMCKLIKNRANFLL